MSSEERRSWDALPALPQRDDPELAVLMEAVQRLPRRNAENTVESVLRCALGYERTGDPEYVTSLAAAVLCAFRVRRDPQDQEAIDAPPKLPGPAGDASDLDEVFARLGLS